MKIYIRQIRPYLKPLKMSVYDHYPNVYDVWFPEEDKDKLRKQIEAPEHYELMFEERFVEIENTQFEDFIDRFFTEKGMYQKWYWKRLNKMIDAIEKKDNIDE